MSEKKNRPERKEISWKLLNSLSMPSGVKQVIKIAAGVILLLIAVGAGYAFYSYETALLEEPSSKRLEIPALNKKELQFFAGRVRNAPPLVTPSPRGNEEEEASPSVPAVSP